MKDPSRFENQDRLDEINIERIMELADLKQGQVVCDYGAGTGIFTKALAKKTQSKVYALDANEDMLKLVQKKVREFGLSKVILQKVEHDQVPLEAGTIDLFVIITVFHHIENTMKFVADLKTALKEGGKVALVEFHKKNSPSGPAESMRLSPQELDQIFLAGGFKNDVFESLGENMYLCIYKL